MYSFIVPSLPPSTSISRHSSIRLSTSSDTDPSPISLDTLRNFKSFCYRTQDALCTQTAQTDGLGTFNPSPSTYPPPTFSPRSKTMQGGRFFNTAIVSVWSNGEIDSGIPEKEGVGLSLKLLPIDPLIPSLRAHAHYFQINGGTTWWFSGAVDVSYVVQLGAVETFLKRWEKVREERKVNENESRKMFLEDCFKGGGVDKHAAFGFMTQVVDGIWPEYVKLLEGDEAFGWNSEEEVEEEFLIQGGARCESRTVRGGGLGGWRFSLAPSVHSSAGRMYVTLRNNEGLWNGRGAC